MTLHTFKSEIFLLPTTEGTCLKILTPIALAQVEVLHYGIKK